MIQDLVTWIPVTEKLPDKDGYYIVTTNEIYTDQIFYSKDRGWYTNKETRIVVAWMPRLQPYTK